MKIKLSLAVAALLISINATASSEQRPAIYINQDVTTHILMPENIKLVDISTEKVVGDQCADNMLRIKPLVEDSLIALNLIPEGAFMGAVTLIGERHMAQYDLLYTSDPMKSKSLLKITYDQSANYVNPEVPMTEGEMANYAWAISHSGRKFHTIRNKAYGMDAQVYNLYSIGGFFFIDLVLKNKTNIPYDIDQMRITLSDKKETKATNSQTIELTPAYVLNKETSFKKDYRQVIVLPKLTYPEEKVLRIEITEDQISGRVISIPIQYEDILHADAFAGSKEDAYTRTRRLNEDLNKSMREQKNDYEKQIRRLINKLEDRQKQLDKANVKIDELDGKIQKKSNQYIEIKRQLEAMERENKQLHNLVDPATKRADELQLQLDNLRNTLAGLAGFDVRDSRHFDAVKTLKAQRNVSNNTDKINADEITALSE